MVSLVGCVGLNMDLLMKAGQIEYVLQADNATEMNLWMDIIRQSFDGNEVDDEMSAVWR